MFKATPIGRHCEADQAELALASDVLLRLQEEKQIAPLDRYTGLLLCRHAKKHRLLVCALATVLSHFRGQGHTCLELHRLVEIGLWRRLSELLGLVDNFDALTESRVVGTAEDDLPLLLDGSRLYFQKVLRTEIALVDKINRLTAKGNPIIGNPIIGDGHAAIVDGLRLDEVQTQAVTTAAANALCLISGGPGTGKTTVAAAILADFLAAGNGDPGPRVGLAAPTGKAAARLQQAVNRMLANGDDSNREMIKAGTVHRLLGWSPSRRRFKFNADQPLQLDLLIVDEVSMIDLELMRALLDATPINCRLVLLGDRDQLASVAPGNVMTDLCAGVDLKQASANAAVRQGGLRAEHIVLLQHNYRFGEDSGIQLLARAVSNGDIAAVLELLYTTRDDLLWVQQQEPAGLELDLSKHIPQRFIAALASDETETALASLGLFRALTGVRYGPFGSLNLNRLIEQHLRTTGTLGSGPDFYLNQVVMATGNDYALRLFNGDTGIIRKDSAGRLAAVFGDQDTQPRWLDCDRLGAVETAFATTIHKSQGSEFDQVLVVLPEHGSQVLSRELLYTAVTRARTKVTLVASLAALEVAVGRRTRRFSGLADRLWA